MKRLLPLLTLCSLLAGCPDDTDPFDPSACDPRCSAGYQCYNGTCRPVDGGGFVLGDGTLDGDSVTFDAKSVYEGGPPGWFKNSFSHLDTELVSKDDGVNLSSNGMRLELSWGSFGLNLLKNPGFEAGDTSSWTDKGDSPALVSSSSSHAGSYSVGGGSGGHEVYQDVDLSQLAPFIDTGQARLGAGLWMFSNASLSQAEQGRFVASFYFGATASLESYDTGLVTPTAWTQYTNERLLPPGIRKVRAWHSCAADGSGTSDCFADDMELKVKLQRYPASADVVYGHSFPKKVTWGTFSWSGILPPGTSIHCSVRTSESGLGGWGTWSRVAANGDDISALAGVTDGHQAIEIKFHLGSAGVHAPTLTSFLLHY